MIARQPIDFRSDPVRVSFVIFIMALCVFGGSSRPDVLAQPIIRTISWMCLVVLVLTGSKKKFRKLPPVWLFVASTVVLAAAHLVPLPPAVWLQIPGRQGFNEAVAVSQSADLWRPLAISPSAAWSALGSLIVPVAAMAYASGQVRDEALLNAALAVVLASLAFGLLQAAGLQAHMPFLRETDAISGAFANRNHFALLMAIGIVVAPAWAIWGARSAPWRLPFAAALGLLLVMAILASGSRAGTVLGLLSLGLSAVLVRKRVQNAARGYSRRALLGAGFAMLAALGGLIAITFRADRALSITRALTIDPAQDLRSRALPTMFDIVEQYFPFGSGLGGFDTVFRVHEPLQLLDLLHFNHAHNDYLEIALDAGLPGIILIATVVVWWGLRSVRAWRAGSAGDVLLPRLGSAVLLLILLASLVDYPARTPVIMVIIAIAAVWLDQALAPAQRALPPDASHL